jgi:hypothetical protein
MPISFFLHDYYPSMTLGEPCSEPQTPLKYPSRHTSKMYIRLNKPGLSNSAKLDSVHGNLIIDVFSL